MIKAFRECVEPLFWIFLLFYFLLDSDAFLFMVIGTALGGVLLFAIILISVLLDAIIGYALGEDEPGEKEYEYWSSEYTEKNR